MSVRSKIEVRHRRGCTALYAVDTGQWFTPWACVMEGDPHAFRDLLGRNRRGGGRLWHRFRCNDIQCPATVLVLLDQDFWSQVTEGRR